MYIIRRVQDGRLRSFLIGCIGVSGKTKWDVLDGVVRRLFKVNTIYFHKSKVTMALSTHTG